MSRRGGHGHNMVAHGGLPRWGWGCDYQGGPRYEREKLPARMAEEIAAIAARNEAAQKKAMSTRREAERRYKLATRHLLM